MTKKLKIQKKSQKVRGKLHNLSSRIFGLSKGIPLWRSGRLWVVVFAGVGSLFVFMTSAQKLFVIVDLDTGSRVGNAAVVSDSTAAGGKYLVFSATPPKVTSPGVSAATPTGITPSTPGANGASGGATPGGTASGGGTSTVPGSKPGAGNTGPTLSAVENLTASQVASQIASGRRLFERVNITGGNIIINKTGVTFRNFTVNAQGARYAFNTCYASSPCRVLGSLNFLAEDGEVVNIGSGAINGWNYTARRLEVHESAGDAFKILGSNVTIEGSWWHHLGYYPTPCTGGSSNTSCPHADGVQAQSSSAANIMIRGNNCDMSTVNLNLYHSNACFLGDATEITFENNWFNGGNYTIYCGGVGMARVINNKFGRDYRYGIRSGTCDVWSGNTWEDTGQPV